MTTRRYSDLLLIITAVVLIAYAPIVSDSLKQKDWYRSLMNLHAVTSGEALSVDVEGTVATLTGTFIKRRCVWSSNNYFTRSKYGYLVPARDFTSLVKDRSSIIRPPSEETQQFGPWQITSWLSHPTDLVIISTMQCPEGTFSYTLIDVPWKDYERIEE